MANRSSFGPMMLVVAAMSCSFYVACGDDDVIFPAGGMGGQAEGGSSGVGGSAGNGGAGGTMAGTGGTMAGTGGEDSDGGIDGGFDGGFDGGQSTSD